MINNFTWCISEFPLFNSCVFVYNSEQGPGETRSTVMKNSWHFFVHRLDFFPLLQNRSESPHSCGSISGQEDPYQLWSNPDNAQCVIIIIKHVNYGLRFIKPPLPCEDSSVTLWRILKLRCIIVHFHGFLKTKSGNDYISPIFQSYLWQNVMEILRSCNSNTDFGTNSLSYM